MKTKFSVLCCTLFALAAYALEPATGIRVDLDGNIVSPTNLVISPNFLPENAINESRLADDAVTESKIAGGAVTSGKLAPGAVEEDKIADESVTTNKLAAAAIEWLYSITVSRTNLIVFAEEEYLAGLSVLDPAGFSVFSAFGNGNIEATGGEAHLRYVFASADIAATGSITANNGFYGNGIGISNVTAVAVSLSSASSLSIGSSGKTNTSSSTFLISVTAGSGMSLKDSTGATIITPVVNNSFPFKPGWRFSGTGITAIAVNLSE